MSGSLIAPLLAQITEEKLRALQQGFKDQSAGSNTLLFGTLIAVAVLVLVAFLVRRVRDHQLQQSRRHLSLFAELIDLLKLDPAEAAVLRQIGRRANLPIPAVMLLSPANLAAAVAQCGPLAEDPLTQARLTSVCRSLFDCELPAGRPAALRK